LVHVIYSRVSGQCSHTTHVEQSTAFFLTSLKPLTQKQANLNMGIYQGYYKVNNKVLYTENTKLAMH